MGEGTQHCVTKTCDLENTVTATLAEKNTANVDNSNTSRGTAEAKYANVAAINVQYKR